jgi:hypothetical protein
MPDIGIEAESSAGGRLPLTWAKSATVAQVVAIPAGVLAMASALLMWRIVGYTSEPGHRGFLRAELDHKLERAALCRAS